MCLGDSILLPQIFKYRINFFNYYLICSSYRKLLIHILFSSFSSFNKTLMLLRIFSYEGTKRLPKLSIFHYTVAMMMMHSLEAIKFLQKALSGIVVVVFASEFFFKMIVFKIDFGSFSEST